jgi:hypothetical protein
LYVIVLLLNRTVIEEEEETYREILSFSKIFADYGKFWLLALIFK